MAEDKTRIRFRKEAELRLLSHHDLARAYERLLRRSELPFESTTGFHPHPRIIFPLSLPLGVIGYDEIVEIEWKRRTEPEVALTTLQKCGPPGITFVSARRIPVKQTARCRRVEYTLPIPEDWLKRTEEAILQWGDAVEMWVERFRPRAKRLDIRPFVQSMRLSENNLLFSFWVTGNGTAKAEELARLMGLGELLNAGACWTRSRLEVFDELSPEEIAATPKIEAREVLLRDLPPTFIEEETLAVASAEWGASTDGPVVE